MRSRLENNDLFEPLIQQGLRFGTQKLAITAAYTFSSTSPPPPFVAFDPAATTRVINLPPIIGATLAMEGRFIRIFNVGSGAGNLTVKSDAADGASTLSTVGAGNYTDFCVVNSTWVAAPISSNATGATTITSAASTALVVGPNGLTNPTLQVDASTATAATGLKIKSAAAAGGLALSVITSGTNENLTIDAAAAGTLTLQGTATGLTTIGHGVTVLLGSTTLAAGTTAIAPLTFTSGTNLTSAVAGSMEYDGKCFYGTAVTSARQVNDMEQFICLTANGPTDSGSLLDANTAAAVFRTPTNGRFTLAAATSYFFEGMYLLSNTGTTSHTWATLFLLAGGASLTSISYTALAYTGTTSGVTITAISALQIGVATQVPVTAASTSATEFVTIILKGIMRVNAGGTVCPQLQASARPGASGTPGVTILAGSYFRVWAVGANTVASVGAVD